MNELSKSDDKLGTIIWLSKNLGWNIIPIDKNKVTPVKWKQYQTEKISAGQYKKWFGDEGTFKDFNIAVITGKISGVIVIDIDPRHGGSKDQYDKARIVTISVNSGGGGWHFYHQYEDGIKSIDFKNGIEIKSDGSLAILPPSIHGSGKNYGWKMSPQAGTPITPIPEFIKAAVNNKKTQTQSHFDPKIIFGSSEGTRNNDCVSLMGKWLHHFPEKDFELVWDMIQIWNERNNPPLHLNVLREKFIGIAKAELASRDASTPVASYRDEVAVQWKEPIPITDLQLTNDTEVDWIWEGFIGNGYTTLLSALWKSGKTTLLCWLMSSIINDLDFAYLSTKKCKILILSEESEGIWAKRREDYNFSDQIYVSCRPNKRRLSYNDWCNYISKTAAFCKEKEIGLVVIDSLTTFWSVRDENDSVQVISNLLPLNEFTENNLALLLIHHVKKGDGDEGTASRGSGALPAYVDVITELRRYDAKQIEDTRRVLKTYSRFDITPKETVLELTPDGYIGKGTRSEVSREENDKLLFELLPTEPQGVTVTHILAEWSSEEYKPVKTTILRWLKRLEKQGRVKNLGKSDEQGKPDLWGKSVALQDLSI